MFRLVLILLMYCNSAISSSYLFINQQQGDTVSVFDRDTLSFKTKMPALEGPAGIAIHGDKPWIAVTYPEQGMVSFFDTEKLIPLEHLSVGGSPFGVVFANKLLFYSDWDAGIVGVIQPSTGRVIKKIIVGKSPAGIATDACESQVWVLNRESNDVFVIDSNRLKVIKKITVGAAPFALALDEQFAYIANSQENTLSIVDLSDFTEIKRIKVGRMPYGVAIDRKQQKVYVSNQLENTVTVLDSRSHKVIKSIATGAYPENIAVDEKNRRLFVLNWMDANISVFDSQTGKEIKKINVAEGSRAFGQFVSNPEKCQAVKGLLKKQAMRR